MVIDQRNNGASVTVNTGNVTYTIDRWFAQAITSSGVFTVQRSTTAPTGFINSLVATVSTIDSSLAATDLYLLSQSIEGFNVADLGWGTASAATVTLSFWVRSSVTGTFGGSLSNSTGSRSYPFTYTISASNTWEQKSITITGDTSGTWLTDNGVGLRLYLGLGIGSTYSGTAGAWAGSFYISATGATNLMATLGATFYITGVQLEKGVTATSFDYRPYGTELALCQRYYYRITLSSGNFTGIGRAFSTTQCIAPTIFPCTMRSAPTALEQSGTASDYAVGYGAGSVGACSSVPAFNNATIEGSYTTFTIASGLTAGGAINAYRYANSPYLGWSAEL
jgi:hypothetical protein